MGAFRACDRSRQCQLEAISRTANGFSLIESRRILLADACEMFSTSSCTLTDAKCYVLRPIMTEVRISLMHETTIRQR